MPSHRGDDANLIEFLDPPEPVSAPAAQPSAVMTRIPAGPLGAVRAPWVVAALALTGGVAVIVAQFLDQFSVDVGGGRGDPGATFGVDGFGHIHVHHDLGDFGFSGHEARLGVPALVAAAILVLGTGCLLLLRRWPVARGATALAGTLTGVIAGCLISVSLVACDNSNDSWSFEAGWWLYALGTVCLALACLIVGAPDGPAPPAQSSASS